MSAIVSQMTRVSIVYSAVCPGTDHRKLQNPASLAFVKRVKRWPLNSPHKGPVTRKVFPFDDTILRCVYFAASDVYGNTTVWSNANKKTPVLCLFCAYQISINDLHVRVIHYDDVIMDSIASQITSLTIVYSNVYSSADQSKHQSSESLAFVWGIHRGPVNSPHKWPVTRKIFPFDDVIMCDRNSVYDYWVHIYQLHSLFGNTDFISRNYGYCSWTIFYTSYLSEIQSNLAPIKWGFRMWNSDEQT